MDTFPRINVETDCFENPARLGVRPGPIRGSRNLALGLAPQKHILGDVEMGHEGKFLEDDSDAEFAGVCGRRLILLGLPSYRSRRNRRKPRRTALSSASICLHRSRREPCASRRARSRAIRRLARTPGNALLSSRNSSLGAARPEPVDGLDVPHCVQAINDFNMTPPIGIGTLLLLPSSFRRSAMGACKAQHLLDGFSSRGQAVSSGGDAALRHDLGSPIGRRRGEAIKCLR